MPAMNRNASPPTTAPTGTATASQGWPASTPDRPKTTAAIPTDPRTMKPPRIHQRTPVFHFGRSALLSAPHLRGGGRPARQGRSAPWVVTGERGAARGEPPLVAPVVAVMEEGDDDRVHREDRT